MEPELLIRILVEALSPEGAPGVVSAYLFGSEAEGRAHRESDVDVGVLLDRGSYPTHRDRFEFRTRLMSRLMADLNGRPVDLLILNDIPAPLARRIITRGLRITCSDPESDHAFTRDAQLRAADLDPFLQRMRRIKLAALGTS